MKKLLIFTIAIFFVSGLGMQAQDADLGKRASWMKGAWGLNFKPCYYSNENVEKDMSIDPFMEQIEDLSTIDYIQIHLNGSSIYAANHTSPHDILESLWEGDMSGGSPINLIVPRSSSGLDPFEDWLRAIKARGLKTQVYVNSKHLMWDLYSGIADVTQRWRDWCDDNASTFINSKSYHTMSGYPDRPYYFCYAEYILKEYAERYGTLIDAWLFDTAYSLKSEGGDDNTVGNVGSQRIYEAYADACHAGNPNAAISFNNGTGNNDPELNPFATPTLFDDYTFGHPFGGAGDMTEPEVLYDYNYGICTWMSDYEGLAFLDDGISWNNNIVSHFDPKMSTTAWNRGATPCLTNNEFVLWNATGLINGGAISWGAPLIGPFMTWDTPNLTMHDYAVEQLTLADAYLLQHQGSSSGGSSSGGSSSGGSSGGNLALSGTANQSSTDYSGVASRAIDGNTNGAWSGGSVTHTAAEDGATWSVDLASESTIDEIVIYNRTDACCMARLSDFTVFMWNESGTRTLRTFITSTPNPSVTIDAGGVSGKSIMIQSNLLATALSLAEVEVYGSSGSSSSGGSSSGGSSSGGSSSGGSSSGGSSSSSGGNIALSGTAAQSSTTYSGVASRAIDGNTNGAWSGGSVTHTAAEDKASWSVDLASESTIDEIVIYNRTDACCMDRLSSFIVFMWDESGTRTLRKVISSTPNPSVTIDAGGVSGKSIMIKSQLLATALNLAEVEVYGSSKSAKLNFNNEVSGNSLFKVYPNPMNNHFVIEVPNAQQATYTLINYAGQTVLSGNINGGSASIDVSGLTSGFYLVKVCDVHETYTRKIMKK